VGACNNFVSIVEQNFDLRRGFADAQAHGHDAKDPVAFLEVAGRIEVARPGKIDIDDFLDRGGTIAHDEDAISELNGFLDIVRDEEDRFPFALPDAHQIGTHFSFAIGFKEIAFFRFLEMIP
jgi:hypothetical protein